VIQTATCCDSDNAPSGPKAVLYVMVQMCISMSVTTIMSGRRYCCLAV
jgi:hypothetical protein